MSGNTPERRPSWRNGTCSLQKASRHRRSWLEGKTMNRSMAIDHITLCVKDLHAAEYLFAKILGFEVIWSARDVGSEKSSMDTIVVQRGNAKVALMQGRDKAVKSQITEFIEKYGQGVQHVAIEVDDIEAVCREWEEHGVQFSGPLK